MTRYRLKKDLPLAKAWTEVKFHDYDWIHDWITISNTKWDYLCDMYKKDIPEWLEEINEPKSIYDIKKDGTYWYLDNDLKIRKSHNVSWSFIKNAHACAFLTEREAKRNKLLRELACRNDKFLPRKWEIYITNNNAGNSRTLYWEWDAIDYSLFHKWLIFRHEEEYDKYLTEEAKDLLFKL